MSASDVDPRALAPDLPFASALPALAVALESAGSAVIQAPPGSGKTTLAPVAVAESCPGGRVVVTQPRRVAARTAAHRLAQLTGTVVGEFAGYTVRGDRKVGRGCRIEFVTPGVLLRRLLADAELPGVAAVVLDEVHERHLESDLALGMCAELRELRPEMALVAMSATLDAGRFAELIGSGGEAAPLVDVAAEPHPLDVRYAPATVARFGPRGVTHEFLDHVAEVAAAAARETGADGLVFVPGVREIDHVIGELGRLLGAGAEVLGLHGGLAPAEQSRIVSGRGAGDLTPRIVVSTDVAESSLTVPGVRFVVDACLSREPRLDTRRGMSGLVTVSAARDSGVQRAGRAARLGPGLAVRCVAAAEWAGLPERRTPAIQTSDLTSAALLLACWGTPRGEGLALPDPPPARAIDRAEQILAGLGAVDDSGAATPFGNTLASVPADPRLARALVVGAEVVGGGTAAEVVALLTGDQRVVGADLPSALRAVRSGRDPGSREWRREAERLEALVRGLSPDDAGGRVGAVGEHAGHPSGDAAVDVGFVVALAFPDLVARRQSDAYLTVGGTGVSLPSDSRLGSPEWLAVADVGLLGARGAVVRAAAPLTEETALRAAPTGLRTEVEHTFDDGRLRAREVRKLGAIPMSTTAVAATVEVARTSLTDLLRGGGLDALRPGPEAAELHRRLALLHHILGDPWPEVSGQALADRIDDWLSADFAAVAGGAAASSIDLSRALQALLPWPEASRLDELVPRRLVVPSGSSHALAYPPAGEDDVVIACKLQECFGWTTTPRIVDGRVPVTVHLLSPAGRPLAQSRDLEFFWREVYPGVRAEMRGRYPKHPWPEDPLTATPTARTTKTRS